MGYTWLWKKLNTHYVLNMNAFHEFCFQNIISSCGFFVLFNLLLLWCLKTYMYTTRTQFESRDLWCEFASLFWKEEESDPDCVPHTSIKPGTSKPSVRYPCVHIIIIFKIMLQQGVIAWTFINYYHVLCTCFIQRLSVNNYITQKLPSKLFNNITKGFQSFVCFKVDDH